MKTIIIDKKDYILKIDNKAIKLDGQSIPLKMINHLILNHKTKLSTKDLLKLNASDVSVLILSHDNSEISLMYSANQKNAILKQNQYFSLKDKLSFAKYFIDKKIKTHKEFLDKFNIEIAIKEPLKQVQLCSNLNTLMGIEGAFAREYFITISNFYQDVCTKVKEVKDLLKTQQTHFCLFGIPCIISKLQQSYYLMD